MPKWLAPPIRALHLNINWRKSKYERIKIFDTTLRDGEQAPGCSMHLSEKIK